MRAGAGTGLLQEATGSHSDSGGFPFNRVCLFLPGAPGTPSQGRMTHRLPGLATLWETLGQGPFPRRQGPRCTWALPNERGWTQGGHHARAPRTPTPSTCAGFPRELRHHRFTRASALPVWKPLKRTSALSCLSVGPHARQFEKHPFQYFRSSPERLLC